MRHYIPLLYYAIAIFYFEVYSNHEIIVFMLKGQVVLFTPLPGLIGPAVKSTKKLTKTPRFSWYAYDLSEFSKTQCIYYRKTKT